MGFGCWTNKVGAHQNLNGSHDLTSSFSGWFAIRQLALAIVNVSTKFEVYISPLTTKIMKGDIKCRNGVVWVVRVTQGQWK